MKSDSISKTSVIFFLGIAVFGAAVLLFFNAHGADTKTAVSRVISKGGAIVKMTKNGFEPEEIKIKKGQTVTWVNEDTDFHWPASNLHPTHQIYPEFDSRKPLAPGEHWSVTFEKTGEWRCHDHLNPRSMCMVRVEK